MPARLTGSQGYPKAAPFEIKALSVEEPLFLFFANVPVVKILLKRCRSGAVIAYYICGEILQKCTDVDSSSRCHTILNYCIANPMSYVITYKTLSGSLSLEILKMRFQEEDFK